jgi:sugar (pentulose or hexulose) kinase
MPKYNPEARGSFTGLTPAHTAAHFARSIMESVACMLQSNLLHLNLPIREIRVMGGGAKSPLWCQIKADLTGKKLINLYEGTSQYAILSMMRDAFMWVSPTPAEILERYSLVQKRCDAPAHKYKDVLIYREGSHFSALDRHFLDKLYEVKNQVAFGS